MGADSGLGGSPYAGLVGASLVRDHWRQQDLQRENYLRANRAQAAVLARGERPKRLNLPDGGYTYVAEREWEQAYIEAWSPKEPEPIKVPNPFYLRNKPMDEWTYGDCIYFVISILVGLYLIGLIKSII